MAIAVPLAIAAVTALAGAYAAYKKGEISKEDYENRKRIAEEIQGKLKAPPGTAVEFTPEEYAYAQQYVPQIAQHIQEKQPQIVTESGSQFEKRMQRDALAKYSNLANTGQDNVADAQREEALFEADSRDKSRRAMILRDMANRGLSGSGMDLLGQQQSSQDAAVGARQASLDAVKQAEVRRLAALGSQANLAGQVRGQNTQVEQTNAQIMNSFNQRLANSKNLYNQQVANTNNDAQRFNIGNKQQVDMANTGLRNQANMNNITRQENAQQRLLDFQNASATGNLERLSELSKDKAAMDREQLGDYFQTGTGAVSAGMGAYSAGRQSEATERAAAQKDRELDLEEQKIQNDTNKTRSLYS